MLYLSPKTFLLAAGFVVGSVGVLQGAELTIRGEIPVEELLGVPSDIRVKLFDAREDGQFLQERIFMAGEWTSRKDVSQGLPQSGELDLQMVMKVPDALEDKQLWAELSIDGRVIGSRLAVSTANVRFTIQGDIVLSQDPASPGNTGRIYFQDDSYLDTAPVKSISIGTGLTGGGSGDANGAVSLTVDTSVIQQQVTGSCAAGSSIRVINSDGTVTCEADDDTVGWGFSGDAINAGEWLGTSNGQPLVLRSNSRQVAVYLHGIDINTNSHAPSLLAGADFNRIDNNALGATVAGGGGDPTTTNCGDGSQTCVNRAGANYATVSGGWGNTASGDMSTVSGGVSNTASDTRATVSGGHSNTASGFAATISGGARNTTSGDRTTVSGGTDNTASGNYATVSGGYTNTASGLYSTVGGGNQVIASGEGATVAGGGGDTNDTSCGGGSLTCVNRASADYATVSGGWGNTASGPNTTVSGGYRNTASGENATISGGGSNTASNFNTTVSGGKDNTASGQSSAVSGGLGNTASGNNSAVSGGWGNTASGLYSTVGGGYEGIASGEGATVAGGGGDINDSSCGVNSSQTCVNRAGANYATVSGGWGNTASNWYATVAGGYHNTASGEIATVSGGHRNTASGYLATVSGGDGNTASGDYATVSGGSRNQAGGDHSLAAGYLAVVRDAAAVGDVDGDQGTFIWSDATASVFDKFTSTGPNQFLVRATGGMGVGTNAPENQFHVVDSINAFGFTYNHVAQIENTSSGTSADGVAIVLGTAETSLGGGNNFITFFAADTNGNPISVGAIEGTNSGTSGGVVYRTTNADFAEYLPLAEGMAQPEPGRVLGLAGGRLTDDLSNAERVLVVSDSAGFVGNGKPENEATHVLAAFMGQVRVAIEGKAEAGDWLVATDDGSAVAVRPEAVQPQQFRLLVGKVLEGGQGKVLTLVGLPPHELLAVQQQQLAVQQQQLNTQQQHLARLESALARFETVAARQQRELDMVKATLSDQQGFVVSRQVAMKK